MGDSRLAPLVLSEAERLTLQGWASRRVTAQGLAQRARIVMACADGFNNTAVAGLEPRPGLWESSWPEFTPFLQFDAEIRRIVCTTNSIESVNARIRKAVRSRGHFPTEQAVLKCVYMAVMSLDPTGAGRKRWKGAMNAFDLAFDGRLTAGQL